MRDFVVVIDMGRLYTESGRVPKQVGQGWIRELAEYDTGTKQVGKPGNNVCLWVLPYFLEA